MFVGDGVRFVARPRRSCQGFCVTFTPDADWPSVTEGDAVSLRRQARHVGHPPILMKGALKFLLGALKLSIVLFRAAQGINLECGALSPTTRPITMLAESALSRNSAAPALARLSNAR